MASAAQNITRHFRGDWRGHERFIPTPGHSANDRGTTVRDGDDGDVVFHSFNGGDWRTLKDECRAAGLLPPRERREGPERVTGIYEFVGADGVVAYRTRRIEQQGKAKRFIAERPDSRGGWINGIRGIPRILYRLSDVLAAPADEPIYLVEGERKADKLAGMGFAATAIAFGAKGGIDQNGYAEALVSSTASFGKTRPVVILPDNDDQGRSFAEAAVRAMSKAGGRPLVVELPGLPPKGDIVDWTGTADDLRALAAVALNPPVQTLPLADLSAWGRELPVQKAFSMAGLIPREEVTLFTGAGGTNKSTFGLQLCARARPPRCRCLASGRSPAVGSVTPAHRPRGGQHLYAPQRRGGGCEARGAGAGLLGMAGGAHGGGSCATTEHHSRDS